MKKYYEIALMQHVHGSVEDDYETVCFEYSCGYGYYECKRKAKELSKYIGQIDVPSVGRFAEHIPAKGGVGGQHLDAGLAAVRIVCYTENEYTTYEPLYYEYYKDGKVDYKLE